MQIDVSTGIAILAAITSTFTAIWLATARFAAANYQKDLDRRLDKIEMKSEKDAHELKDLDKRQHQTEKDTIRQDGAINLVQSSHANLESDISEIKRTMATKNDLTGLGREIAALISGKRTSSGQHSFSQYSSGASEASSTPAPRPRPPSRPGSNPDHTR